jgi:hypothetical protein
MGRSLGWDQNDWGPVSLQLWHAKVPYPSIGQSFAHLTSLEVNDSRAGPKTVNILHSINQPTNMGGVSKEWRFFYWNILVNEVSSSFPSDYWQWVMRTFYPLNLISPLYLLENLQSHNRWFGHVCKLFDMSLRCYVLSAWSLLPCLHAFVSMIM